MAILGIDQVTIVDLTDGYTVNMSPESWVFAADNTKALAATATITIDALVGKNPTQVAIGTLVKSNPNVVVASSIVGLNGQVTVTVGPSVTSSGYVDIPVVVGGDVTITKRFAYALAFTGAGGGTGAPGVSASNGIIGNEAAVIAATPAGATLNVTTDIQVPWATYVGGTRVAGTIATSGLPAGMTVKAGGTTATTSTDGLLTLTVPPNTNLGGTGVTSGEFTITVSTTASPGPVIAFPKKFSWALSTAGSNGTNGTNGADAIVMAVTSSAGTIFKNSGVATTLTAHIYRGGSELTAPQITALGTVKWYKDGSPTAAGTGLTLVLDAGMVTNKATYEARLEG